ncbi:CheA Signal Transduction Histidine Kinases (STHK) [Trichormus variabilis ATCC 29413]|uniref:histidine kinase n=2 Tax=Anabaena variabilis TaxID=264691 RepID=Q3MH48_TRIV2|nr:MULTISPECIES: hybrid sensor histidine kinase/response regulator [Nostocaceae]ABA19688.1 CheA Signal Transduction Histidine Kinases (STHK) [Trichormus variabilis ATCC 29413]MBC1213314.1 hybrid sensor histidine kinase/response regulator [Trichormus variabilis ARAD]MBC1255856.1 hybrid sensor histidine kinase/response regulator [Trichormus variabilis V5]MBC1265981.1 hybrid sensor histidine kinase/response regulator [Trichormus variabilis FSR]MBC1302926.1 hybrid sensor histidine kinase/response 
MSKDKELEIQMQFLEEATDYINTLEGVLLEIDTSHRIDLEKINGALRAAHSIKGGAAMMGFRALSDLSHRLEDAFKVLKTRKNSLEIDTKLQSLLLSAVDWLRQIVQLLGEGNAVEEDWLATFCHPVFDELRDRLGDPTPEDAATMLSPEEGQDIIPLLFESEIEGCLQRLESVLADQNQPCLQEEVAIMAAELGGLGEMLQLPAFTQLCESIKYHIENANGNVSEIAQLALQTWRRSQALVLTNQRDKLPTELQFGELVHIPVYTPSLPQFQADKLSETPIESNFIPEDLTVSKNNNHHPLNIIDFPEILTEFAKENITTDYTLIANKDREHQENTVRVPSKQLEEINDLFGELIIQRNGLNSQIERLRKLVRNLNQRVHTLERENQELRTIHERKTTKDLVNAHHGAEYPQTQDPESEFDALEMDRYNELNLRSQTVVETIVQVQEVTTDIQLSVDDTDHVARKLNKTSKQLQTKLNHIRMRPMSDLVERFPRAIRDLNVEYGKNVQLKITGGNTLIERSILEALNEPLMHLLRNAFDHGIEESATRQALGKPEQGLIEITATHRSNRTIITMRDDGRGISLDKIRTRAQGMGIDAALLANATDEELLSLIFEPGFTTSEQVTALSGRGVGMDVVRNNLKLVRGDITVDTELGVGTTFTLSVPFTLSIARVLLIETNKMLLAFPTDVVSEIFLLQNEQVFPMAGNEVLNWQGTMLPLIRLGRHLEFNCPRYDSPELETPPAINAHSVLIVKGNNQPVAILVDRCWGEQEVAIRQVEGNIPLPQGFSNCTILGDGRVVALVNTNELLYKIATNQHPTKNLQSSSATLKTPFLFFDSAKLPAPPTQNKGTILIIDDSINVRRFLALTLEKGGYQVEQAKDGEDAWEKLESGLKVKAVICDIEMPRLDGYGFLDRINSNVDTKNIPVAMLTSRSSNKHRQLAMQLGARAYFSKPYNEQELLGTLEELIFNVAVSS